MVSKERRTWLAVAVGLLLVAYALRVYRLEAQDIWGDEAWSVAVSGGALRDLWLAEANPPAYHLLLYLVRPLWGNTPFALRYLSVLSGLLAVALTGRLGQTAGGRPLGLAALLAAGSSAFLVYYAQEARMYGPALVGATGSVWLALRLAQHPDPAPWRWWVGYAFFSLLGLYSHYYMLAVMVGQALGVTVWLAWRARRPCAWLPWALTWVGLALLFLPFVWLHQQVWGAQTDRRLAEWSLTALGNLARRVALAYGAGVTLHPAQQPAAWLALGCAVVGLPGWRSGRWAAGCFLVSVVVGGVGVAWLATPLLPFFWERYLLVALPPFLVLVGAGWLAAARLSPWLGRALTLGVVGVNGLALVNYYHDPAFAKGGYGQLMSFVAERMQPGDMALLNNPLQQALWAYYRPADLPGQIIPREALLDETTAGAWLASAVADYHRVWLVDSGHPAEYDPDHRAQAWLAGRGRFALRRDFPGASLALFVLTPPTTAQQAVEVVFDERLKLVGYSLENPNLSAGEAALITLYWEAMRPVAEDYTVFVHLVGEDGRLAGQVDSQPAAGSRPTSQWQPGVVITDPYALLTAADIPTGRYHLQVGLYTWPSLLRLPITHPPAPTPYDAFPLATLSLSP